MKYRERLAGNGSLLLVMIFGLVFQLVSCLMRRLPIWRVFLSLQVIPLRAASFEDFGYKPPSDWVGEKFVLSQRYPLVAPKSPQPWKAFNPESEPEKYLWAVLDYCYEGTVARDFRVERAQPVEWFHVPGLHKGLHPREFVHGLTEERESKPYELGPDQKSRQRNFAVAFYNAPGGYVLGKVWAQPTRPDPQNARFPEGTVAFKLLFTTAPVSAVPFLDSHAPRWNADIDRSPTAALVRQRIVRLLQVDIAVKDERSLCGGWIFGTFHYDKNVASNDPWRRLQPLALAWGNDPKIAAGAPRQSWVNPSSPLVRYRAMNSKVAKTLGRDGRANGAVDNPVSSCMSCHATAAAPENYSMIPGTKPAGTPVADWFQNVAPGKTIDPQGQSLDFSLQLALAIQTAKSNSSAPFFQPAGRAPNPEWPISRSGEGR